MKELTQEYADAYMLQTAKEWAEPTEGCPPDHDTIGAFLGLTVILVFIGIVALTYWRKK